MRNKKKNEVQEKLDEVILEKIEEVRALDVSDDNFEKSAGGLYRLVDARNGTDKPDERKKDFWSKIGVAALGILPAAVAALITAAFNKKTAEAQMEFTRQEHLNAYSWEEHGNTNFLLTSPTSKEVIREKPKIK